MNKEDNEKVLDLICMAIDETNELRKRIKETIEYIENEANISYEEEIKIKEILESEEAEDE